MNSTLLAAALAIPLALPGTPPRAAPITPAPAEAAPAEAAPVDAAPIDTATLRSVPHMTRARIAQARADGLPARVATLLEAPGPLPARLLAARALARLGTEPAVAALAAAAKRYATPEEIALAREAARALKQLRADAALAPALASPDPEVRSLAAGAGGEAVCALLASDPWPMVRIAAAQGLAGQSAACLAAGLIDAHEGVSIASARAAIDAPAPALRPALRRLAANPQAATEARAHAFVALAALDDLEPATAAMKTHLASGAIEPLALAAVRAFARAGAVAPLTEALGSARPAVVRAAARALLLEGSPAARAAVAAAVERADPRQANVLRRLTLDLAPARDPGEDPAADDPE